MEHESAVVPVVASTRARSTSLAGRDCDHEHAYPALEMCSGPLCQEWLGHNARPEQCPSEHAHTAHYRMEGQDITICAGRAHCSEHVWVLISDCGLNGPWIHGVYTSEPSQAARDEAVNRAAKITGYQFTAVEEYELDVRY